MISVCVATYNGESYLKEQLESILQQLGSEDELILSDDGSTDKTTVILQEYQNDSRVQLLKGPQKGLIANFEHAIKQAKGELIFLADQDDVWQPGKVREMMKVFNEFPQTQVVISDLAVVDEKLNIIYPSYFDYRNVQTGFFRNIVKNKYIGAGMAFRKELKAKILPFPENIPMHDMWIGLLAGNNVRLLKKPLTLYRRHSKNSSEIQTTSTFKQKLIWRVTLITQLFKRLFL